MSDKDNAPATTMIFVEGAKTDTPVHLVVNGISASIPRGVDTPVRDDMLPALGDVEGVEYRLVAPEGKTAGAGGVLKAGASDPAETIAPRSGPDDQHGKPHVDKDHAPEGYQPDPGAAGAPDTTDAALGQVPTATMPAGAEEAEKVEAKEAADKAAENTATTTAKPKAKPATKTTKARAA